MSSPFRRSLPARPDLEQQKSQAKELLQSYDAGDAESRVRIRTELPDKKDIALADAQFVLAREYGFTDWGALKQHIESHAESQLSPEMRLHQAVSRRDAKTMRQLLEKYPPLTQHINAPIFAFDSPPIVALANDAAMVDVLLDFGADPNQKSNWWAGGFHALYSATGAAADRLIAAGAVPDACALAHLDRVDELAAMIAANPECVHERGGDGQMPLHFAESRAVVDLLLDSGADIDARDIDHRATAAEWMLASPGHGGRIELARYLVSRGASTDIFLAAALGLVETVREMLTADPSLLNLRTGQGAYGEQPPSSYHIYFWSIGSARSPMDVAAQYGHERVLDVMRGFASPLQRLLTACRRGQEAEARAIVRDYPDIVQSLAPEQHRLAADAAWAGDARALGLMLDLGFDPRAQGQDTGSALHCAAWEGSADCVALLLKRPDARELVAIEDAQHKATPLGWCGHGSLHGNPRHDHARVAKLLLEAGADPERGPHEASPAVTKVLEAHRRSVPPGTRGK